MSAAEDLARVGAYAKKHGGTVNQVAQKLGIPWEDARAAFDLVGIDYRARARDSRDKPDAERDRLILRLRRKGLSFRAIGEALDPPITAQRAHVLHRKAKARTKK